MYNDERAGVGNEVAEIIQSGRAYVPVIPSDRSIDMNHRRWRVENGFPRQRVGTRKCRM